MARKKGHTEVYDVVDNKGAVLVTVSGLEWAKEIAAKLGATIRPAGGNKK